VRRHSRLVDDARSNRQLGSGQLLIYGVHSVVTTLQLLQPTAIDHHCHTIIKNSCWCHVRPLLC